MLTKARLRLEEDKAGFIIIWLLWLFKDMLGVVKIWDIVLEVIMVWSDIFV